MKILYFDGICGLCNGFVDFLLQFSNLDQKKPSVYFSPLQSGNAKKNIPVNFISNMDTIVYFKNGKMFTHSSAVIEVLYDISRLFFWIKICYLIPQSIRNYFYILVSSKRYSLFGVKQTCRIPSEDERQFFILD